MGPGVTLALPPNLALVALALALALALSLRARALWAGGEVKAITFVPIVMSSVSLKRLVSLEGVEVGRFDVELILLVGRTKYVLKLRGGRVSWERERV